MQNKKIYINESLLLLCSKSYYETNKEKFDPEFLHMNYRAGAKQLFQLIDKAEKLAQAETLILYSNDFKKLWKDFKTLYKVRKAAGAVVINSNDEILSILRLEKWDLPKGKLEKKESRKKAAYRELLEETGIAHAENQKPLIKTYHSYKLNGIRNLKDTKWYQFTSNENKFEPQTEENIIDVSWKKKGDFLSGKLETYQNILEVIKAIN